MNTKQSQSWILVTHHKPHFDEMLAMYLLQNHPKSEQKYPGITKSNGIKFWNPGSETPDGKSWQEWLKKNHLLIGVGGSQYDEHASLKEDRKENECAATLVAKDLGIEDEPQLQQLLKYAKRVDLSGSTDQFSLASLINLYQKSYPDDEKSQMTIINWAMQAIHIKYLEQKTFFETSVDEFRKNAQSEVIQSKNIRGKIKNFTVVSIISDDPNAKAVAMSTYGVNADVVIIQKKSQNTIAIITKKQSLVPVDNIVRIIRTKENAKRNFIGATKESLVNEKSLYENDPWYYFKDAGMLLNGSERTKDNKFPTRLPFNEIVMSVKIALNNRFHQNHYVTCNQGICAGSKCPWYCYGLSKCSEKKVAA